MARGWSQGSRNPRPRWHRHLRTLYLRRARDARRMEIHRPPGCRAGSDRRRGNSRGLGHHQRHHQALLGPSAATLHGSGDSRLDGRICGVGRIDNQGRQEADLRLPRSPGCGGRCRHHSRRTRSHDRLGLRRPLRQGSGWSRLDSGRRDRQREDRPAVVEHRAGRTAQRARRPRGCTAWRQARHRAAHRGPVARRICHAGLPQDLEARLGRRTPSEPHAQYGQFHHGQRQYAFAWFPGEHGCAGVALAL